MLLSFLSIFSYGQELAFKTNGRLILGGHKERTASIGVGDIDILITNRGSENEMCLNDGTGKFSKCLGFGTNDDSTIDVEVADMDGDNDYDLILANRDEQQNFVYLNDGRLDFSEKIPFGTGKDNTRSVAVADFNNDGYLDIIESNSDEVNRYYFNLKKK